MIFLLIAVWLAVAHAFILPSNPASYFGYSVPARAPALTTAVTTTAVSAVEVFNSFRLRSWPLEYSTTDSSGGAGAPSVKLNDSCVKPTTLAEITSNNATAKGGDYRQIARPRWYNKAEAAVIVLLVQRLRLLDARGVEHMLESTDGYRKVNPVRMLLLFLAAAASASAEGLPAVNQPGVGSESKLKFV